MKKFLKYYSLNVREPFEIDTTPYISKNLQYVRGLPIDMEWHRYGLQQLRIYNIFV